jgi:SPP1 gp7 family putative phage head morphogenesis protein
MLAEIQNHLNANKDKLESRLKPTYDEIAKQADAFALRYIRSSKDPIIADIIVKEATNKIRNINNHTYRLIRTQVKTGIEVGETLEQIANRIKTVYKFNASRTSIISRTETNKMVNKASFNRYNEEGIKKKVWLSAGDDRVREEHRVNDALGPVDIDFVYPNGARHPGDGGKDSINCRCSIAPVIL